ncbi:efflux RND transporter periplasmic adaptor subunit [Rhodobium gokarnense]|uniref:HlyD family secretion protein n=1 Tax=Rhodobium gokarnense TaxID=364296 RepID=A0ABT3HGK0_9HYPH|nr:HlyD family efflux transporter periplasmic adaptor subunit [Rhodobium gokarnense]MCW2309519.1 HlyD family secretion protein [Rhodobium gokarnense]
MGTLVRRLVYLVVIPAVAGTIAWAMWPRPVSVDTAEIVRQPLEVTVEDEGVTRIREVYTVSAPISGKVTRAPREVGDAVTAGTTVVAEIMPTDPTFLDARSRRVAEAAVEAARAAVQLAAAEVKEATTQLDFARSDLSRAARLAERKTISVRTLEKAEVDVTTAEAKVASAKASLEVRRRELESARAQLIQPGAEEELGAGCCVNVPAPVSGRVLKLITESETVVTAGTGLLEIGDPHDLEIVVDLLSRDAVRVTPGAEAQIVNWGGPKPLKAVVKRVDPAAFTKISALGIEEQRVKTILDLTSPEEDWASLGHAFRVVARIVVWRDEDAVTVPLAALFRRGEDWAVFKAVDGTATLQKVEIGERNLSLAEVKAGLEPGDTVIVHPSDKVADGVAIEDRGMLETEE